MFLCFPSCSYTPYIHPCGWALCGPLISQGLMYYCLNLKAKACRQFAAGVEEDARFCVGEAGVEEHAEDPTFVSEPGSVIKVGLSICTGWAYETAVFSPPQYRSFT